MMIEAVVSSDVCSSCAEHARKFPGRNNCGAATDKTRPDFGKGSVEPRQMTISIIVDVSAG
jgi:hypothetical protein